MRRMTVYEMGEAASNKLGSRMMVGVGVGRRMVSIWGVVRRIMVGMGCDEGYGDRDGCAEECEDRGGVW